MTKKSSDCRSRVNLCQPHTGTGHARGRAIKVRERADGWSRSSHRRPRAVLPLRAFVTVDAGVANDVATCSVKPSERPQTVARYRSSKLGCGPPRIKPPRPCLRPCMIMHATCVTAQLGSCSVRR